MPSNKTLSIGKTGNKIGLNFSGLSRFYLSSAKNCGDHAHSGYHFVIYRMKLSCSLSTTNETYDVRDVSLMCTKSFCQRQKHTLLNKRINNVQQIIFTPKYLWHARFHQLQTTKSKTWLNDPMLVYPETFNVTYIVRLMGGWVSVREVRLSPFRCYLRRWSSNFNLVNDEFLQTAEIEICSHVFHLAHRVVRRDSGHKVVSVLKITIFCTKLT